MPDTKDWIYARVLKKGTFIFPRHPYWFGWVEFVPLNHLDADLANAISRSLTEYGMSQINADDQQHVLVRTIVLDSTSREVEREAFARIREAIDIFTYRVAPLPAEFEVLQAGALLDILANTSSPLLPPWKGPAFTGAIIDDRAVHPSYILNLLLTAPTGFGQLGLAFARSQHWKMLAGTATTVAEKVLLHWMAAEALCSVRVGADPIPNLMYVSGFPIGQRSAKIASLAKTVRNHSIWRKRILKLLDTTRKTRNVIVHEGHRDTDIRSILGAQDESDALLFLRLSLSCLYEHSEQLMTRGSSPLAALWEGELIDTATLRANANWIVDHLEGTFSGVGPSG